MRVLQLLSLAGPAIAFVVPEQQQLLSGDTATQWEPSKEGAVENGVGSSHPLDSVLETNTAAALVDKYLNTAAEETSEWLQAGYEYVHSLAFRPIEPALSAPSDPRLSTFSIRLVQARNLRVAPSSCLSP